MCNDFILRVNFNVILGGGVVVGFVFGVVGEVGGGIVV